MLAWGDRESPTQSRSDLRKRVLLRKLRNAINPLNNPLLPMRYISRIRREGYYRRTLTDKRLAREWADHFLKDLDLPPGAVALDFGCGRGRNAALLAQLGFKVVGQDITVHPWWASMPDVGFQTAPDFTRLPWKDHSVNLFLATEVIHYVPPELLDAHAAEVWRVLKPGAYWVLLEANEAGLGAAYVRKQIGRLHSLTDVERLVSAKGFKEHDRSFEGYYARRFPGFINFVRKQCSCRPFDLYDWRSRLAARLPDEKRALWLLRLQKPAQ